MSCQALHRDSKMRVPAPKPLFGQLPSTSLRYRAVACPAQPEERRSTACIVADHQDHFRSARLIQDTSLAHGNKSERDSIAVNHSIEVSPIVGQRHAAFSHYAFQARTASAFADISGKGKAVPSDTRSRNSDNIDTSPSTYSTIDRNQSATCFSVITRAMGERVASHGCGRLPWRRRLQAG